MPITFKVECIDGLTNTVHFLNGLTLHPGEVVGSVNEDDSPSPPDT